MAPSTTERTISSCNALQISSIPKEWADQAWNSDFIESQGLPEVLESNIFDCGYFVQELQELLVVSRLWTNAASQGGSNEGLWKVLSENNLSHRVVIAVLHSFIESCDKTSNAGPKLESCVLAANVYIVLVQIPGSGAYKVFHPLLFQKALDVLRLWPQKETNKRKRREDAASTGRKAKTRRGRGVDENDCMEMEDASDNDDDGGSNDEDDEVHGQINTEQAKANVKVKLLSLLQDAVILFNGYSFKDSEQAVHHVIQLLVETTRLEAVPVEQITFDFPATGNQIYSIKSIASLAYIGLSVLCSPLHDVGAITRTVFKHLISNVLMVFGGSVASNGVVVREVQTIKDHAVKFICHMISKENEDVLSAVQVLVQHLCTKCPERAEYRSIVAKAVFDIVRTLPVRLFASLMEWINKYSKNAKISYRIFALDVISLLIVEPERPFPSEHSPNDNIKKLLSKTYLLDIIIARCSDKAPTVRAKALQCFAQCATSENSSLVIKVKETLHEPLQRSADSTPTLNRQSNGQQAETRSIGSIIRKRTCDEKVGVRKAALQALESVITLNLDSLEKADVLTLHDRCMDPALSVRRQAMVSLTSLLQERPACTMVHSLWLDGVLPLVMDRESTAQEKCFQILEEVLLSSIVAQSKSTGQHHILAWNLLDTIASPSGQEVRRYLHYAFQHWSKQNKLSGNLVKSLMSHIDTEHNKAAWLCLAEIGSSSNKLDHSFVVKSWNEFSQGLKDYDCETLCRILAVLGSTGPLLPSTVTDTLKADLQRKLIMFDCSPEVIAAIVSTLCKLCKVQPSEEGGNTSYWCSDLLKASEEFLSGVTLKQDSIDEELLTRHLFTVGEVAQLAPTKTTERLFMFVESMLISHNSKQDPLQRLNLSPPVKAHAFVTLGKLCLQNEDLAKQCIAALARELETSDDPAIRNNVTVVMCDLCVRYTSLVDRYVPNIAACLKDSASLVRRQTLTLLTHLLQEDFVKWKGSLFYRFITTLVDEDQEIRKFADFCLVHLLLTRHPGMLYQHFVECVFHFNSFEKHRVYNKFPQTDREKNLFSLKGDQNSSKRFTIYQFMLTHMSDEDRFHLTGKLCQEVLGGFTDGDIILDQDSASVLKDALLILSSKNIKLSSMRAKAAEDLADEGDMAGAAIVQARNKFLTQVLKKNMIENIIPIIIELKHMLEKQHSPLLKELMSCLKEVMKDYRSEVQDVLSADRQLANEIEFDLKRFEEQQKELEEQRRKQNTSSSSPQVITRQPSLAGNTPTQVAEFKTPQLRNATPSPNSGSNRPNLTPLAGAIGKMQISRRHTLAPDLRNKALITSALKSNLTVQVSPLQSKRRHTLTTAAILNSARKAVNQAHKVVEQQKRRSIGQMDGPCQGDALVEGSARRTPLKPTNSRAFQRENEERAASTPEGERSHLSRISFCVNASATAPPSPIPTSLPIRVFPKDKGTPPSWIEGKAAEDVDGDGEEKEQQIICLMSPEQKLPKPRTWNIKSPERKKPVSSRKEANRPQNDSVSGRTRSRKRK